MADRKVLVVDDEPLARRKLVRFLDDRPEDFVIAEAGSGTQALERIRSFKPEIIFLDVQMPGLDGFGVLHQLEERPFQIVFQTAFDSFAVRAFEEHACDYLLKPFTRERFDKALDRACCMSAQPGVAAAERQLLPQNGFLDRLAVRTGAKLRIVKQEEFLCLTSVDHVTLLHTRAGAEHVVDLSLTHLEERLSPAIFLRVHRNAIVRMECVTAMDAGSPAELTLDTGAKIPISRRSRAAVEEWLKRTKA